MAMLNNQMLAINAVWMVGYESTSMGMNPTEDKSLGMVYGIGFATLKPIVNHPQFTEFHPWVVWHSISLVAPALRLPGSIIYSKIHCVGKCPFYMGFSNVFCVSEDVNSSVVDHGARGHFWKMSVDEKHQFNKMCWFWRMEEANSMEGLPILSSVRT